LKILITGGSGYLAGIIGFQLFQNGHDVTLASRNPNNQILAHSKLNTVPIDYNNPIHMQESCKGVDVVIYCSGLGAKESLEDPKLAIKVNGQNPNEMAKVAKSMGVKLFVYLSTVHVYSENLEGSFKEESRKLNQHPYATSHALGEKNTIDHSDDKFKVVVLRLANVFGQPLKHFGNASSLAVHDFVRQALTKGVIEINSESNTLRNFVPSRYVSRLMSEILSIKNYRSIPQVMNVAWSKSKTLFEIAVLVSNSILKLSGVSPKIQQNLGAGRVRKPLDISSVMAENICRQVNSEFGAEVDDLISFMDLELKLEGH
jgi:UDP-glucose 4-epimerase